MGFDVIICEMCGKEFRRTSTRGVAPKYCSDVCREKANKEARRRYVERAKDKKRAKSFIRKVTTMPQKIEKEETTIQCGENIAYKRGVLPKADELTMEVLDFAMRLGQLKYEGTALVNKLTKIVSEQDKQDQKFIHLVEAMDVVTVEQMKKIWQEEADSRTNRRDAKVLYSIVNQLVYGIPQNPHQFAKQLIERKDKANESYANQYKGVENVQGIQKNVSTSI